MNQQKAKADNKEKQKAARIAGKTLTVTILVEEGEAHIVNNAAFLKWQEIAQVIMNEVLGDVRASQIDLQIKRDTKNYK